MPSATDSTQQAPAPAPSPVSPPPPDLSDKLPRLVPRGRAKKSTPQENPPLETPPLPPPPTISSTWEFVKPSRRILSRRDHDLLLSSPTHTLITSFIFTLSDSVRDAPISSLNGQPLDPIITTLLTILDDASKILAAHPPSDTHGSRFGNATFRHFLHALTTASPSWHASLGLTSSATVEEVSTYLAQSFGNLTRIDYGSGHELNFFIWLLCLNRLSLLPPSTFPAVVLRVFPRYLTLMRDVQVTYYLEPAGSHGVWGLDDYQFLPFLFGASQLASHPFIRPLAIHNSVVLEEYGREYMYLDQVRFVNSVKTVEGLRWHSPMLDDISSAKSWAKIEQGMRRMFVKEVLGKLPVMQHFLFGSLVPAVEGMSTEEEMGIDSEEEEVDGGMMRADGDEVRHVHGAVGWGDCCGIKVPSSVGAAQEMKKRMGGEGLRRMPFD